MVGLKIKTISKNIIFLFVFILIIDLYAQVFVPLSFWQDTGISIPTLTNIDGPQYVTVSHSFVVTNRSGNLTCTSTYFSATSSNTAVVSLVNITFSGTFPNCVVSYLTTVSTGTTTISVQITNQFGRSSSQSFTFTAYQKPAMAFSFRKVVKDYVGSAIRVRRISDDVESDIGFDSNGNLDLASYTAFQGGQQP